MPIQSFIAQPVADSVQAAYRPVVIRVSATKTGGGGGPLAPVVYCDIYFNDIFYKTLSKSQYTSNNGSQSQWEFDIQDAAQEYLGSFIANLNESAIVEATDIVAKCYCKLRSSGYDADGFIVPDGTAPIQGTSSSDPVAGTGDQTEDFYVVNATLQHEDSQDLATHLAAFKTRTWTAFALPLTHRPDGYALTPRDSDSFPLIVLGTQVPRTLRLNYRYCNQQTFTSSALDTGPAPMCTAVISDPAAAQNVDGWMVSWSVVSGSPAKYFVSTPTLNGGAPYETTNTFFQLGALAVGSHTITVRPLCFISGVYYFGTPKTVSVTVTACVAASISGSPTLPDAQVGTHYHQEIALVGTVPFEITALSIPGLVAWLNVTISGAVLVFDGDPGIGDVDTLMDISVTVENACGEVTFEDQIDVTEAGVGVTGNIQIGVTMPGMSINSVLPAFYTVGSGTFPVSNGSSVLGTVSDYTGPVGVGITKVGADGSVRLYKNAVLIECLPVTGSGAYMFADIAIVSTDNIEILLSSTPC